MSSPRRGEIYWTALDPVVGREQAGTRPAVIVQNDAGNANSDTTIVAPVTSSARVGRFPFGVQLPEGALPRRSVVNCAQVRTIDRSRLIGDPIASLDEETMLAVDDALRVSLGLY